MKCPFCGCDDTQVKDSRNADDNTAIRRRRECPECGSRFTTYERVQLRDLIVVKRNGEKVPLNFAVKLNDFNIEFYEGTKTAKAFTSNISIIENNNEVKNTDINVNHPLKYKDVVFYQASYGQSAHNDMLMNVFISKDNKSICNSSL